MFIERNKKKGPVRFSGYSPANVKARWRVTTARQKKAEGNLVVVNAIFHEKRKACSKYFSTKAYRIVESGPVGSYKFRIA